MKSFSNKIIIPEIKFLNRSWAPRATTTPNKPSPAITGPIFIPQISRTATVPKKIIKYFKDLIIHKTKALDKMSSNLWKRCQLEKKV